MISPRLWILILSCVPTLVWTQDLVLYDLTGAVGKENEIKIEFPNPVSLETVAFDFFFQKEFSASPIIVPSFDKPGQFSLPNGDSLIVEFYKKDSSFSALSFYIKKSELKGTRDYVWKKSTMKVPKKINDQILYRLQRLSVSTKPLKKNQDSVQISPWFPVRNYQDSLQPNPRLKISNLVLASEKQRKFLGFFNRGKIGIRSTPKIWFKSFGAATHLQFVPPIEDNGCSSLKMQSNGMTQTTAAFGQPIEILDGLGDRSLRIDFSADDEGEEEDQLYCAANIDLAFCVSRLERKPVKEDVLFCVDSLPSENTMVLLKGGSELPLSDFLKRDTQFTQLGSINLVETKVVDCPCGNTGGKAKFAYTNPKVLQEETMGRLLRITDQQTDSVRWKAHPDSLVTRDTLWGFYNLIPYVSKNDTIYKDSIFSPIFYLSSKKGGKDRKKVSPTYESKNGGELEIGFTDQDGLRSGDYTLEVEVNGNEIYATSLTIKPGPICPAQVQIDPSSKICTFELSLDTDELDDTPTRVSNKLKLIGKGGLDRGLTVPTRQYEGLSIFLNQLQELQEGFDKTKNDTVSLDSSFLSLPLSKVKELFDSKKTGTGSVTGTFYLFSLHEEALINFDFTALEKFDAFGFISGSWFKNSEYCHLFPCGEDCEDSDMPTIDIKRAEEEEGIRLDQVKAFKVNKSGNTLSFTLKSPSSTSLSATIYYRTFTVKSRL